MSYRCINAFDYANRIYPGGAQIEDDDPILATHAAHFAKVVTVPSFAATETASASPGEVRVPETEPEPERPRRGRPRKHEPAEGADAPEQD